MIEEPTTPAVTWVYRTLIVPAEIVQQARAVADAFGPSSSGMWITGLSPTGTAPATHYISAGLIGSDFAVMLASPEALVAGAAAMDAPLTVDDATGLLGASVVDERSHAEVLEELGLQFVRDAGDQEPTP